MSDRDGLKKYRAKRDFSQTPEPSGEGSAGSGGGELVVQKHAARQLHYDLRLQIGEVLKSWAVPKGPSLDPADRRLAVHVEDHPLDYGSFEGAIPEHQYGAGTVMLWDKGTWEPLEGDAEKAYRSGKLKFRARGKRMRGGWMLVRMRGRKSDDWLLIKENDRYAKRGAGDELVQKHQTSAVSGRTMSKIAAARDRVWQSDRGAGGAGGAPPPEQEPARDAREEPLAGNDPLPAFIEPALATRHERPPQGAGWAHEIKLDGYRLLGRLEEGRVQLLTRRAQDWTRRFPDIGKALARLSARTAMLDGEAVVLGEDGRTSFASLQASLKNGTAPITYCVFDLLHLDGRDLKTQPLVDRKARLKTLLADVKDPIRYVDHLDGSGDQVLRAACSLRLEGVVSKRRDAPYRSGRSDDWRKSKCVERQEFVVIGFTEPSDGGYGIGSLALATRDGDRLVHVGRVGTGYDQAMRSELRRRLEPLRIEQPPVPKLPADARRGAHWVKPELVVEVEFQTWTTDGQLRHASFQGIREDKTVADIQREVAEPRREAGAAAATPRKQRRNALPSEVAGVQLTSPDKVLWPKQGITKLELAEYLEAVSEHFLRHAGERPLTLVRCPEGRARKCFFQKHATTGMAEGIRSVPITEKDGAVEDYLYISTVQGLVALAQLGVLEMHPWGARVDDPELPDLLVFDLDPDEGLPWAEVVVAAHEMRARLRDLGLESFTKTTGGKGVHVVAPVLRKSTWDDVRDFPKALATTMATEAPNRFTANLPKAARRGKIFIDYLRNQRGATAVAAYSPRARDGAPVAMPVTWEELTADLDPRSFTVATVPARLARNGDIWRDLASVRQQITARARRRLGLDG